MKKDERIQKLLNRIAKKGDIHDAISKKKNVIEERTITKIIKTHIILFSRIFLYITISLPKSLPFLSTVPNPRFPMPAGNALPFPLPPECHLPPHPLR